MTPAPERWAEQHPRRAVVYLYSQTGQLREVADALTAPLAARGWRNRWVDVEPRIAFPFPWPIPRFFRVFPAAVDPEALVELVEPRGGFEAEPSVEVIAATGTRRRSTTLVTTLRWLLSGKREPFLWSGRAGVGGPELGRVADVGQCIAESGPCPQVAAPVVPALAAADLLAGRVFRRWGAGVRSTRRLGAVAQAASLAMFLLGLEIGIVAGMPLIGCAALAGGARFDTVVGEFVHRRISFDTAVDDEAASA